MNESYGRLVSRAAIAATIMASSLLVIKIFAWWYTGSVSILAALVDSLVDIAASLTNLLVVRYSLQPADDEHTFGHGKADDMPLGRRCSLKVEFAFTATKLFCLLPFSARRDLVILSTKLAWPPAQFNKCIPTIRGKKKEFHM